MATLSEERGTLPKKRFELKTEELKLKVESSRRRVEEINREQKELSKELTELTDEKARLVHELRMSADGGNISYSALGELVGLSASRAQELALRGEFVYWVDQAEEYTQKGLPVPGHIQKNMELAKSKMQKRRGVKRDKGPSTYVGVREIEV